MYQSPKQIELERVTNERRVIVERAIALELVARGHVVETWKHSFREEQCYSVDGHSQLIDVICEAKGEWRREITGRLRAIVGGFGDKKQFPEPKAGFDIKKICDAIEGNIAEKDAERARRNSKEEWSRRTREFYETTRGVGGMPPRTCLSENSPSTVRLTLTVDALQLQKILKMIADEGGLE